MRVEDKLRAAGVEVRGTFDARRFYEALARVLSKKFNMEISVKVYEDDEPDQEPDQL